MNSRVIVTFREYYNCISVLLFRYMLTNVQRYYARFYNAILRIGPEEHFWLVDWLLFFFFNQLSGYISHKKPKTMPIIDNGNLSFIPKTSVLEQV